MTYKHRLYFSKVLSKNQRKAFELSQAEIILQPDATGGKLSLSRRKLSLMQKILAFLALAAICSCEKYIEVSGVEKQIIGTWEYEQYVGYPANEPPAPAHNGRIIVIGADGGFERRQHDSILFRGTYTMQNKRDCLDRSTDLIFSTNDPSTADAHYIDVAGGKLMLSSSNCLADGGTAYYRRLK